MAYPNLIRRCDIARLQIVRTSFFGPSNHRRLTGHTPRFDFYVHLLRT
jgi:hypothetical protein